MSFFLQRGTAARRRGASFTVRLATVTPESPEQVRDAVLEDLDALEPGLRPIVTALPIAGAGAIDLLASDERGRLAVVSFCAESDAGALAQAMIQWEWAAANRALLRVLLPMIGLDLSREPRLLLVACAVPDGTLGLASRIARPEIEIHEATLIVADGARGVLLRRTRPARPAPAEAGAAPALADLPPGEARSLMRRVLEELRDAEGDGDHLTPAPIEGGIDLRRDGRAIASLVSGPEGIELRLFDPARSLDIASDAECRHAVRVLLARPSPVAARPGASPAAGARPPASAALTPEEIAEFGRPGSGTAGRAAGAHLPPPAVPDAEARTEAGAEPEEPPERGATDPPPVRIIKTGFMEN